MNTKAIFTSVMLVLLSISTWATPIPAANLGGFDIIYHGEYFMSEDNLSGAGGDTDPLLNNGEYTNFSNLIEMGYTMKPALRLSLGGVFAYATSSAQFTEDRSNSEFNAAVLSAQYYMKSGKLRIVPNFRASLALNEVEISVDEVMTGESSNRYETGAWVRYPFWVLDNYLYLGYIYQEDEKADLFNWSLGTKWNFSKFTLRGQLNGVSTVADDGFTDTKFIRHSINDAYSAGSLRYNSVNPSYIEFDAIIEYNLKSNTRFGAGLGHTITGKNYGFGPSIMLTYSAEFRTDKDKVEGSTRLDGSGDFQPELESFNEDLFN